MKKMLLTLVALAAILVWLAPAALAEAPFATDLVVNTTNATADFELAEAMQPEVLSLSGVLPLSPTPQTVTVSRVHGDVVSTLHSFVLASNVASGSEVLTNASWILLQDKVRIAGPTNATLEFQGNR